MLLTLLALGCTQGVDLHPELAEGDRVEVSFEIARNARLVVEGFAAGATVTGTRQVEVTEGGRLGRDPLTLREHEASIETTVRRREGPVTLAATDADLPPLARRWVALDRRVTLRGDGTASTTPAPPDPQPGDDAADLERLWEALLHAPEGRLKPGATWSTETGDGQERRWTLASIQQGVAVVEEINRVEGQDPNPELERRSRLTVDARSGRPLSWRMRDLRREMVAIDVEAELTWRD